MEHYPKIDLSEINLRPCSQTTQLARNILGISAECSLSVEMFRASREHFKGKDFLKNSQWKSYF